MRYLNSNAIMEAITYEDIISAVEKALSYYKTNTYNMPDRFHYTHDDKTLLYMPCFSSGILGTKILTVFPHNTSLGHPVIDGLMLLNDYDTGAPKAMIDGKLLTALRTGAVGAMGSKYIASQTARTLGLIGAGAQGIYQILFACSVRPIQDVFITSRNLEKLDSYIDTLKGYLPSINFHQVNSAEEVVRSSEIIITATSSMSSVLPEDSSLYIGKTFIAIGSYKPDMRELPDALMQVVDEVYVDIEYAKEESGDLKIPIDNGVLPIEKIYAIADLIHGEKELNAPTNTVVYKSVGMGLFDVIVADRILTLSIEKNIGQLITL